MRPQSAGARRDDAVRNDRILVGEVLSGDTGAFAALYRAHAGAVARVVRDNVHDPETVADVVQEVFARALARLATLNDPDRFRPWLLSIARHAAIDQRRSRVHDTDTLDDNSPSMVSLDPGPHDAAELVDLARLVRGCVAGLSARDATALTLVLELGLSPAEVATPLGVSVGAAKVIVHRARHRLRAALALELMVRRRADCCEEFVDLHDRGDLVAAGRHVQSCAVCAEQVRSEVTLYGADHSPPATLTDTALGRHADQYAP